MGRRTERARRLGIRTVGDLSAPEPPRPTSTESIASAVGNRAFSVLARAGAGVLPEGRVHPEVGELIHGLRGRGAPLESGVRERFAASLGDDLRDVRVHTGATAGSLARSVSARAFAVGRDVFFGADEYRPGSESGDELLAHELAHVAQQRGSDVSGPLVVSQPGDAAERDAERYASDAVRGRPPVAPVPVASPAIGRQALVMRDDGTGGAGQGGATPAAPPTSPRGSEANPYVAKEVFPATATIDLYDEDVKYDDKMARMELDVTWHKIDWRGKDTWIPHEVGVRNSHGRGLKVGAEATAVFTAGAGAEDPLTILLNWTVTIATADVQKSSESTVSGSLSAEQKTQLGASAKVAEGVDATAGVERGVGASLGFSQKYATAHLDAGAAVQFKTRWTSRSGGGVTLGDKPDAALGLLEADETLKDHYGGWFEGDLDLKLRMVKDGHSGD